MTDKNKLIPTLERILYDERFGTDTRFGLGPEQIFVDPEIAKSTLIAILSDPDREFAGVDIDYFVNNTLNFDTPEDTINTMDIMYSTFPTADVNYIFFQLLQDAFVSKSEFEEIFKTSWVALQIEQNVEAPAKVEDDDVNIVRGGGCFTAPAITPTVTPSSTPNPPLPSPTPSVTPTQSPTPTVTPTSSVTPSVTPTPTVTPTPSPVPSINLNLTLDDPNAYSTSTSDTFGKSVSIFGNNMIVSAYLEDDASGLGSGKAYLYDLASGTPSTPTYTLDNPNPFGTGTDDNFGWSVHISDKYAVVSSAGEDQPDEAVATDGTNAGKVYVYDLLGGDPSTPIHTIKDPNTYTFPFFDRFGHAVHIHNDYLLASSINEDDAGGSVSGAAFLFDLVGGTPTIPTLTFLNPNSAGSSANDNFGFSLSMYGNYIAVGAYGNASGGGTNGGTVYIYDITSGTPTVPVFTIENPSGVTTSDYFGWSVDIEGTNLVIGAYGDNSSSGTVYVYNVTTASLIHTITNPNAYSTASGDSFGNDVEISGNYIVVSALFEDDAGGVSSGKAYIYNLASPSPTVPTFTIDNPNPVSTSASDFFSGSVSISALNVLIGAEGEDDTNANAGKAYVYTITP